ncbi:MAG: hypothetical protein M3O22_01330 [Pseudomonadota bacterium]|nr:hypothetical protein [Pseudomonadota bacterium]
MIPALLAQGGIPLLVKAVSAGLKRIDSPVAKTAAGALDSVDDPQHAAGEAISAMASLGTIWIVGLSVLGIYVYKQSEEKKGSGDSGNGLLSVLGKTLAGKKTA